MDDLQAQLQATFLEEAVELLENAEQAFLELESGGDQASIIAKIFRLAHNLKGSARAVGFTEIGTFTHTLESFLLKIKENVIALTPPVIDLLLRANDHLTVLVGKLRQSEQAQFDENLRHEIAEATEGRMAGGAEASSPTQSESQGQDRFNAEDVINAGFTIFDEPASTPQALPPPTKPMPPVSDAKTPAEVAPSTQKTPSPTPSKSTTQQPDDSIRVSLGRLETLVNNIGELVILQTVLSEQKHQIPSVFLQKTITQLSKITKDIQDISMGLRMVSLKQTFSKMQRIVRDTSKSLAKDIQLELSGEDTELDKTVVDHLGDPLVHLIRNACDHGLETPEERVASGKSRAGRVFLSAGHAGGKIVIEVRDDGRGLIASRIKAKAIEKGIIKPDAHLNDSDCYNLLFAPGFSTKAEVTDLSGRGVGLDVVKTNIEKILQGKVQIETVPGHGTTFRITLPLTLAIIDGMVVRCQKERFVIPLTQVFESVAPNETEVHSVLGVGQVLHLRGENLPLHKLSDLLALKSQTKADPKSADEAAIVVRSGAHPVSILVDEILSRQQVVIKKLGDELGTIKGISGGAILGDGAAALILDLSELVARRGVQAQARRPDAQKGVA